MIKFFVNGDTVDFSASPDTPLLWALRDHIGLTGTKFGCGMALCGACTVHVNGEATRSCVTPVSALEGKRVNTIEGVPDTAGHAKAVQAAWIDKDVVQCGYCQSGQIMAATALLAKNPTPIGRRHRRRDERQHLPLRHLPARARGDQGRVRRARQEVGGAP